MTSFARWYEANKATLTCSRDEARRVWIAAVRAARNEEAGKQGRFINHFSGETR